MENIMEIAGTALKGDVVDWLSSQLHESPHDTRRGLETALPLSIAGLAAHTTQGAKAEELLGAIRGGNYPRVDASEIPKLMADPTSTTRLTQSSSSFVNRIFGNKLSSVLDTLSGQTGVSRASASTLLGLATPLVLSAVGKETKARNLDANGLSAFLSEQGRRVSSILPGPFANLFGGATAGLSDVQQRARGATEDTMRRASSTAPIAREPKRSGLGWGALILALLALGALFLLLRRAQTPVVSDIKVPEVPENIVPDVPALKPGEMEPGPTQEAAGDAVARRGEDTREGTQAEALSAQSGTTGFVAFLASNEALPRRYELVGLEFPAASASLPSNRTLDEVANALKQQPSARIRIEGFTDATGGSEDNEALSLSRATAVKSYLVARGVPGERIEAVGRASDRPRADNETQEGRARNRRVELVVIQR
jgi:OOP family OmpA-OmpF porin